MTAIANLLKETVEQKGSDLLILSGQPARIRQHGQLYAVPSTEMSREQMRAELEQIMSESIQTQFKTQQSVDFAHTLPPYGRFRVNAFYYIGGLGAVFRTIPSAPLTLDQLKMPEVLTRLCTHRHGLILVTGKTGSGKSTTLAAMIDHINASRNGHIITIEDPIEFTHVRKRCLFSQREIGQHTPSFAAALRSALREDPDVILVGELRDPETIGLAVSAAEMGILVFGTLHTGSAVTAVDRMVNAFPPEKQGPARAMLSTSLRAILAQQLLRRRDGNGRVAALEILINTSAVSNIVREGRTEQLANAIHGGTKVGMQTMDAALRQLLDSGQIDAEEAYRASNAKQAFASQTGQNDDNELDDNELDDNELADDDEEDDDEYEYEDEEDDDDDRTR